MKPNNPEWQDRKTNPTAPSGLCYMAKISCVMHPSVSDSWMSSIQQISVAILQICLNLWLTGAGLHCAHVLSVRPGVSTCSQSCACDMKTTGLAWFGVTDKIRSVLFTVQVECRCFETGWESRRAGLAWVATNPLCCGWGGWGVCQWIPEQL